MANNDGLYIKNNYLYKEGVGRIHKATDSEKAQYGGSSTSSTPTGSASGSSGSSSSATNRYNTTVTKKDGTTASGYIEDGKSYYSDGTRIGAGDSVVDSTGKVWTMGGGSGSASPSNSIGSYLAQYGINVPTGSSGGSSSGSGSYKVTSAERPNRTAYLRSAKELGELYDINYDMDAIRSIYDEATNAKYTLLSKELEQAENDFYTNNANANATLLDTLKKATSSAIATGASRGIAGAEQLGLMMEAQQGLVEETTNIAQERANMADEIAAEKAQNIVDALKYSDSLKQALAGVSSNVYSADTQYDVGLLDWAAQMKNVEALFEQIASQERVNMSAQELEALKAIMNDATTRSEGDKNRESAEKQNADNAAAQKAYYEYMMKNAGNGGGGGYTGYGSGSGGYYNNYGALDYDKIWAAGDIPMMIQYLTNYEKMSYDEAMERINSDRQFMANATQGGYSNAINYAKTYDKAVKEGDLQTIYALRDIGNGTGLWSDIGNFFGTAVSNPDAIWNAGTSTIKNALTAIFGGGPNQQTLEAAVRTWSEGKLTNAQKEQLVKTLGIPRHTIEGMVETYKKQNKK